jgi:hypothetical protein
MTDDKTIHRALVGNLQSRRQVGRPWTRWADNVRTDLRYGRLSISVVLYPLGYCNRCKYLIVFN